MHATSRFAWHALEFPFPQVAGSVAGAAIRYVGNPSPGDFAGHATALPQDIERAAPRRQCDYLAGRIAARRALQHLAGCAAAGCAPARRADGRPDWPPGIAGSISHSQGIALAVAATAARHPVLGVDVQRLLQPGQCGLLAPKILPEKPAAPPGWSEEQFLTLAFSAKESLFKALSAEAGRAFGFDCALLAGVDLRAQSVELRLTRTLAGRWTAGTTVMSRYHVAQGWVMTAVGF